MNLINILLFFSGETRCTRVVINFVHWHGYILNQRINHNDILFVFFQGNQMFKTSASKDICSLQNK
jgi:hypothetical protein